MVKKRLKEGKVTKSERIVPLSTRQLQNRTLSKQTVRFSIADLEGFETNITSLGNLFFLYLDHLSPDSDLKSRVLLEMRRFQCHHPKNEKKKRKNSNRIASRWSLSPSPLSCRRLMIHFYSVGFLFQFFFGGGDIEEIELLSGY